MAQNLFNTVLSKRPKTNRFDLSHDVKMSGKMGNLYPILAMECVPGDSFKVSNEIMLRFAPLIAPVMHRVNVTVHYFFVPNRILWDGWQDFIAGNGVNPPAAPYSLSVGEIAVGTLHDYMGLPAGQPLPAGGVKYSVLPFAAYNAIYNEYYRDQNLIPEVDYKLIDGDNSETLETIIRKRAWRHDYFTGSLPFAQKGDDVLLPIGTFEDVDVYAPEPSTVLSTNGVFKRLDGLDFGSGSWPVLAKSDNPATPGDAAPTATVGGVDETLYYDPENSLKARTSELEAEAATINNLRTAFRVQEWLEKNARGGTRNTEVLQMHFGVRSRDSRLQRPEYLGGTMQPVTISEVLNTTGTAERPQGDMAGHGISVGAGKAFRYFCEEHGYIMGIMSVMPMPAYQQGISRHFLKFDKFNYYWPTFAHLGEQEVMNQELYVSQPDQASLTGTFGYVPRYAEYKYLPARVAGDFRTTLNFWHMGRIFANPPQLNQDFIEVDPADVSRIFAVEDDTDNLWMHLFHRISAKRPMPKFGTPSF